MARAIQHSLSRSKACREKSAEVIVTGRLQTHWEGLNNRRCQFQMEIGHGMKYRHSKLTEVLSRTGG